MSYRPIYPNNQGRPPDGTLQASLPGGVAVDEAKRRATTACLACKRRKIKCSGRPLPCDPCKIDSIECIVDLSLDGRRKFSVKRIQDDLDVHRRALQQLLHLLQEPGAQKLREIAPALQHADSVEQISKHLEEVLRLPLNRQEFITENSSWGNDVHPCAQSRRSSTYTDTSVSGTPGTRRSSLADEECASLIFRLQTASENEAMSLLHQVRHQHVRPAPVDIWEQNSVQHQPTDYQACPPFGTYKLQEKSAPSIISPVLYHNNGRSFPMSAKFGLQAMHRQGEREGVYDRSIPHITSVPASKSTDSSVNHAEPNIEETTYEDPESHLIYLKLLECSQLMQKLPALYSDFAERLDDHIISVVVSHSWEHLKREIALDPQFEVIETWDELIYTQFSSVDRLGSLRMLRRVAKYFAAPDAKYLQFIPNFYHPQPWQKSIDTPQISDYIAWPGIRKAMNERPVRFQTNKFWKLFRSTFRLQWPYSLEDTCVADKTTSMMRISDEFTRRCFDLEFYCLTKEFFDEYPELKGQARQFEPSPEFQISHGRPPHSQQDAGSRAVLDRSSTSERKGSERGKKRVQRESWTSGLRNY